MRLWVALMLALVLSVCAVAHFAGRLLVVADPLPARADAIVIMAGSVPDRVLEVADLYQAGLAPLIVAEIWRVIATIRDSGISTLIVDRNYRLVLANTERAVVMEKGRIALAGASAELSAAPDSLAQLLGV